MLCNSSCTRLLCFITPRSSKYLTKHKNNQYNKNVEYYRKVLINMNEQDLVYLAEGTAKAVIDSKPISNLTGPSTKSIGQALGDIFDLCFGSLHERAEKSRLKHQKNIEHFKESLTSKAQNIPEENLIKPKLSVIGPAIEASKYYYEEEEIREMFEKLIINSMDSRKISQVHPSFTEVIKQLSPLDAQNLKCFADTPKLPICEFRNVLNNSGYYLIKTNVFIENPKCQDIDLQSVSMSSLSRLELITIDYVSYLVDEKNYDNFEKLPLYKQLNYMNQFSVEKQTLKIQKGQAALTPFGKAFIDVCIRPLPK